MTNKVILPNCLLLSFCLALSGPNIHKRISQGFPEPDGGLAPDITVAGSLNLLCLARVVDIFPIDTDGDGIPDEGGGWLEAISLVDTSFVQCGEDIVFSINREGEEPEMDAAGLLLNCEDLGIANVEVHAWCEGGIAASCLTYLFVEDNFLVCGEPPFPPAVGGQVVREDGLPLEDVEVSLSGATSALTLTDVRGEYGFFGSGLMEGSEYTITPSQNTFPAQNVSTHDMVLISRHILGVEPLGSPYKLIAADVNNSRQVTTLDLITLRRLLLGIDADLLNNSSWRFVARDYVFPNPQNPWLEAFPEQASITLTATGAPDVDFVAVKVGDVSY